ncbi:hypothetical protein QFC21_004194 [Naganishia friedmannii]|uniref:Uncharacterized protein n=1 Tax=Naganishia friedmannii TaxID=89922 RepID=A0ACC2VJJ5_9TREE|nr:hypothetical protein QFC21_004194 [Naganishia friedmannii]
MPGATTLPVAPAINAVKTTAAVAPTISAANAQSGERSSDPSLSAASTESSSGSGKAIPPSLNPAGGNGGTGSYSGPSGIKAPHYVIYSDADLKDAFPTAEQLGGFNRFLLCFWMVLTPGADGDPPQSLSPYDNAKKWAKMDKTKRSALKSSYKAANIALMVSAFGDRGEEGFCPRSPYALVADIQDSHSDLPMAKPAVAIQFYNDGAAYGSCDALLTRDPSQGGTSLGEIATKAGIKPEKLVIGKPLRATLDAGSGWMDHALLATCYETATVGGVMFWQWLPGTTLAVDALKLITG